MVSHDSLPEKPRPKTSREQVESPHASAEANVDVEAVHDPPVAPRRAKITHSGLLKAGAKCAEHKLHIIQKLVAPVCTTDCLGLEMRTPSIKTMFNVGLLIWQLFTIFPENIQRETPTAPIITL